MADTRIHDILEIKKQRERAKSGYERDQCDKSLDRIMRERSNPAISELREKLIMAMRNNDHAGIKEFQHRLMMIQAEQTYGKQY